MKIRTVTFNYKSGVDMNEEEKEKTRVGIIAQEIEKILPNTVTQIEDNGLKDERLFNSDELVYLLIKSVQEQQKQIEKLQKQVETLSKK